MEKNLSIELIAERKPQGCLKTIGKIIRNEIESDRGDENIKKAVIKTEDRHIKGNSMSSGFNIATRRSK